MGKIMGYDEVWIYRFILGITINCPSKALIYQVGQKSWAACCRLCLCTCPSSLLYRWLGQRLNGVCVCVCVCREYQGWYESNVKGRANLTTFKHILSNRMWKEGSKNKSWHFTGFFFFFLQHYIQLDNSIMQRWEKDSLDFVSVNLSQLNWGRWT